MSDIINQIRSGEIDINNQELFFSSLIKGLMLRLNDDISIRSIPVPHVIINTGTDEMYLMYKDQNHALDPLYVNNENYIYTTVPRCVVSPGGIDLKAEQLTNPYTIGRFQYESNNEIMSLAAEFRRLPVKLSVDLKYIVDSYTDLLELTQQILTKLSFIKTYNITYMGQKIVCSYKIPESLNGEYITDMDGTTTDSKDKTLSISIEVETNLPIISERTVMPSDKYITITKTNITS